jgi:tellurite resistance protein TerC
MRCCGIPGAVARLVDLFSASMVARRGEVTFTWRGTVVTGTQVYLVMASVVAPLLVADLRMGRQRPLLSMRAAALWSVVWIAVGLLFGVLVMPLYLGAGDQPVVTYLTLYAVEKSLSIDNVFLWLLVFATFGVPRAYQRRVLFWGIAGAVVLRMALIHGSMALLEQASWLLFVASGVLLVGAVKLWRERHDNPESLEDNLLERWLRRAIPTTEGFRGERFLVREGGRWLATPLLFVLLFVEVSDVVLALDALPAALSITSDPVVITSANLFALLGLRSLYSLLAGVADRLTYLKAAVALILAWIAVTLVLEHVWGAYPLSTLHSLGVIVMVMVVAVVRSVRADDPAAVDVDDALAVKDGSDDR